MPNLADGFPSDEEGFYQKLESLYHADHPDASKVQVSLACGVITKFIHRIQEGDFVICPMGDSSYRVGEVVGGYFYVPDAVGMIECSTLGGVFHFLGIAEFPASFMARIVANNDSLKC